MSLSSQIKEYCKVKYSSIKVVLDQVEISVEKDNLLKLIQFLKDDPSCLFDQLSDITAVDYPNKKYRFLIIYQFLSITNNQRVRVLCSINANDVIPSISNLYFSALWAERELWDMFGVYVDGHPDLRRILTDYGFQGHPLRKDFPLTGFDEVSYETESRRVVYNKVKLTQDYRDFDFNSPWGVADKIKDEKNND